MPDHKIILVTEAHRGLGRLTVGALAHGGHTIYAAIDRSRGANRREADRFRRYAREHGVNIRVVDLDPMSDAGAASALDRVVDAQGRVDVVVQNPQPGLFGPAEASTPAQIAAVHDRSLLGAQRVMRAALPHMRRRSAGLVVWMLSTACGGGAAPYLGVYCALMAGLEAMAVQYAREVARWGVETSIVMPGAFGAVGSPLDADLAPDDTARLAVYGYGQAGDLAQRIRDGRRAVLPRDDIPGAAAGAVAMVVDTPAGERPFRVCADPAQDGASVVLPLLDRVREEMLRRLGLEELLVPHRGDAPPDRTSY
ncbi:SDR family NAD(P)-dependent oxidoreductase [Cupriavidus respiraculi]|uniref:Short-chain dehydrogenase/reductase SDR n=2 Tax=Cupriavidus respiraculi TaxID=195930 RepID=A0ABM8WFJ9_9BURK|nr:SDR family NAD(P)-dependent oxidoreductase [Cupriavidus respiraculi]CAG9166105.1 hypothetical protein LMG21510_00288 [Cupriavidus respiraculi]